MSTELTEGEVRSPFRGDPAEPPFQVPASASGGNVHATDRQQQAQQPKQQLNTADMEPQATLAEPEQGQPRKKQKTDSAGTAALPAADRSASVAGLNNAAAPAAAAPAAAAASSMQASPPDRTAPVPQARAQPPDRGSVSGPGSGNADVQHQTQQRMAGSATASVGYTQPHQQQHSQPHQQQQQQQDTSMPPPRSSMGASSMHQAAAQTAGPAAAQPPSWEAERLRIKQLRQEEKLRLK